MLSCLGLNWLQMWSGWEPRSAVMPAPECWEGLLCHVIPCVHTAHPEPMGKDTCLLNPSVQIFSVQEDPTIQVPGAPLTSLRASFWLWRLLIKSLGWFSKICLCVWVVTFTVLLLGLFLYFLIFKNNFRFIYLLLYAYEHFTCMYVLHVCPVPMFVHHVYAWFICLVAKRSEEGAKFWETRVTDVCEQPVSAENVLQRNNHQVPVTTESILPPCALNTALW